MTREQQEMIDREYNEAVQANDDKRILRAMGHAVISLVDCQRKTAERVKDMAERDHSFETELDNVRDDVRQLRKTVLEEHSPVVKEYQESKLRASGAVLLLKILGWTAAAGGSGLIGWLLAVVNKSQGVG